MSQLEKIPVSLSHPICQQELRGCHPTFDHNPRMLYLLFSAYFFFVTVLYFLVSKNAKEIKMRYDDKCNDGDVINLSFDVTEELKGPVFFYYELNNFYQNHFRFRGSVDKSQFYGSYIENPTKCQPFVFSNVTNKTLAPCGLFPKYFFTDYYTLGNSDFTDVGISWKGEKDTLFQGLSDSYNTSERWMKGLTDFPGEVSNEHFIVWMRTSNKPQFKKLFARNEKNVPVGKLNVTIKCQFPKQYFNGERYISLVRPSRLGGNNKGIIYTNLALFVFSIIGILSFPSRKPCCEDKGMVDTDPLLNHPDGVLSV